MKRIFALLLTVIMLLACLPIIPAIPVSAAVSDPMARYTKVYKIGSEAEKFWGRVVSEDFSEGTISQYNSFNDSGAYNTDIEVYRLKLYRDCTTAEFPHFRNADIEIDLNGHTWTVTGMPSNCYTYGNISISGGTLIFKNSTSCPLYTYGGSINIRNVVFRDCVCGKYGLIAVEGSESGSLQLDNVYFENCSSSTYASCVYIDCYKGKSFQFNNCSFNNCHSQYGGAVYFVSDYCDYAFVNCEFNECYATVDGGAIYCESEYSNVRFTNCNADHCHADDCGGFIFCSGEYTVYNGFGSSLRSSLSERSNIIGCYALDSGGAFYSSVNSSCSNGSEVRNFNMVSNTAGSSSHNFDAVKSRNSNSWGGAVCFRGYDMKLCYCDLMDNYATWYGGAVYAGWSGTAIENCTFDGNRCNDGYGNDLYVDSKDIDVRNCTFYSGNSIAGKTIRTNVNNFVGTYNKTESLMLGNDIEDGKYIIYTALDPYNYCVCIAGNGYNAGENVHLFSASTGSATVFNITKDKERGTYIIKSDYSGYTLDVANGSKENGANITQWYDNGTDAQRWTFEPAGDGSYYIKNVAGQYMDVSDGLATNRANIHSWEFHGGTNQKWRLVRVVDEGDYILRSALDEKYAIEISGGKASVNVLNANVHLWQNGEAEVFSLIKIGKTGTYTIKSKVTGLVLDIEGASAANGANIYQHTNYNTKNQLWLFEPAGDGYYYIRSRYGTCVDVAGMVNGNKPYNGVNVFSWAFAGGNNQKFRLAKATDDTPQPNPNGDGTKENPYKIGNAEQLKIFAYNVSFGETYEGKYFELTNDIAFDYVPIGYYNQRKAFKGHFDGKNHTVNMLIDSENWDLGLFSYCVNAEIKNIRVTGKVRGTVTLAGVCAAAENTTFENCINDADITSINEKYVAGICAIAENCKFISCTNNGTIHSQTRTAGGIAAYVSGNKTEILDCRNNGYVNTSTSVIAGGIAGDVLDHITIKRCTNNGKVEAGVDSAGGIIGCLRKGADLYSCINTENGIIHTQEYAAGILGWTGSSNEKITIANCANYGEVSVSKKKCAGIVYNDNNSNMTVSNCFNAYKDLKNCTADNYIEDGYYIIYTASRGIGNWGCLDICCDNGGKNSGDNVHIFSAASASASVFYIKKDMDKGTYIIASDYSALPLDVADGSKANGANIRQWIHNGSDAQRWIFEPAGDGYFYIKNVAGQYMDVSGGLADNRVNVHSWEFTGAANQKWRLVRILDEGDYYIRSALDDRFALDISGGTGSANVAGANLHIWENGAASVFTLKKDGKTGKYSIKSTLGNMMLDVADGSAVNGANIRQWHDNGTNAERWYFSAAGDGYYYIQCAKSSANNLMFMDAAGMVNGNKPYNGVNVWSWEFAGGDNQKWRLVNANGNNNTASNRGGIYAGKIKGTFNNCYCINGTTTDIKAATLSEADCKNTLADKMNDYIRKNTTSGGRSDWVLWTVDARSGFAVPDLSGVSSMVTDGSGTAADPYLISNSTQLEELNNDLRHNINHSGHYFKLTQSFSYVGRPLGDGGCNFAGIFDGDYHTITVNIEGGSYSGLFGATGSATIKNLTVAGSIKGEAAVGGIVGFPCAGTVIDNCHVTATVTGTAENVGGIAGHTGDCTISNCRVDGNVSTSGWTSVGGIAGCTWGNCSIVNCVSAGTVTGNTSVGGIVGCAVDYNLKIVNCSCLGATAEYTKGGGNNHGGIVGYIDERMDSLTILNCFSNCTVGGTTNRGWIIGINNKASNVTATEVYYTACTGVNVTSGSGKAVQATSKSSGYYSSLATTLTKNASGKKEGNVSLTAWTYDSAAKIIYPKSYTYAAGQIKGSGTKVDPYLIAIPEHLIEMSNKVCSGETYKGKYFRLTRSFIYDGPPVGTSDKPFCGIFDGNDHRLTVSINTTAAYTGLFSELNGATVMNLEVAGKVKGINCLGGIAGYAYGGTLIDNCLVSAEVTGTAENVGGIVGMMDESTVSNCRADGTVTGADTSTGGIVGGILSGGKIVNCLTTKKVVGERNVGGILGCVLRGNPMIVNCSSSATISAPRGGTGSQFGGIIGVIGSGIGSATVANCFSSCTITTSNNSDAGCYFVGKVDASAAKITAEELYYVAKTEGLPVSKGVVLEATATTDTKSTLEKLASTMSAYARKQPFSGVTLTTWKYNDTNIAPKNYINLLSVAGSVFGENTLTVAVVIGIVLFGFVTATTVLYVKKKKTKSQTDKKQQ